MKFVKALKRFKLIIKYRFLRISGTGCLLTLKQKSDVIVMVKEV